MSSVLAPSFQAPQAIVDALFNPDPRWFRSWSTAWRVLAVPMTLLDGFTLPTLDANQLELQAAAASHLANGRSPFSRSALGAASRSPFISSYSLIPFDGSAPVLIGFADGASTPVLMPVPVMWNGVTIDGNAPLLAALRAALQDLVWIAAKFNPTAFLQITPKPIPWWRLDPGSAYP